MKKHQWILFLFTVFLVCSCQKKSDMEKEKEAIKSVIEAELKASFYGDYESWKDFFAHEPNTFCFHSDRGNCNSWVGWEEIRTEAKNFIRPERTAGRIYEGYYDYSVRICEESALATFKTKMIVIQISDTYDCEITGTEMRVLEKQDGQWKITYLGTVYSIDNE